MGAGASQCAMLSVCVREVSILPGRKRGSSDSVKRKRRGKTLGEMKTTLPKKAKKKDAARNAKRQDEKTARQSMLDSLRRDGSEGPSMAPAAAGGTAGPSATASDGAPSSVGPSHPFQSTGFASCSTLNRHLASCSSSPSNSFPDPHLAACVGWEGRW
jgi:hypothetical protein